MLKTEIPETAAPLNASAGLNATQQTPDQVQHLGSTGDNSEHGSSGNNSSGDNSNDNTPQKQQEVHNNPDVTSPPDQPEQEDCFDGVDNDGDGLVDSQDKDCS